MDKFTSGQRQSSLPLKNRQGSSNEIRRNLVGHLQHVICSAAQYLFFDFESIIYVILVDLV